MSKKNVTTLVEELVSQFLSLNGLEIYDCEFLKEGREWYLRLYIDRTDGEYVSTDDCEKVSAFLSEELDREEPIEGNYYLEVSSPGLDRELKKKEHFEKYAGHQVDVKLYKPFEGKKEYTGTLLELRTSSQGEEEVIIKMETDTKADKRKPGAKVSPKSMEIREIAFPKKEIAKISLTVIW